MNELKNIHYTYTQSGDWYVLYFNDKAVFEGHSLDIARWEIERAFKEFGVTVTSEEVPDEE